MVRRLRGRVDRVNRVNRTTRCDERNSIKKFFQPIYNY